MYVTVAVAFFLLRLVSLTDGAAALTAAGAISITARSTAAILFTVFIVYASFWQKSFGHDEKLCPI